VVALDVARHALGLDEGGTEEDERVGRARDVARIALLRVRGLGGGGDARRVLFGYELEALGGHQQLLVLGSHVGGERVRAVRDGCEIGVKRIRHYGHRRWRRQRQMIHQDGTVDERRHVVWKV